MATTIVDNDITLTLARINSLTLQIPGADLSSSSTSNPSSEPSSSIPSSLSDPPSPNPLLSQSNSTAASSNTTIKTSASSENASTSSLKYINEKGDLPLLPTEMDETPSGMATPLSSEDSEQNTRSTASLPTTLSVRFAPLPELAPRKRRSAAPLGMAARKQLMRRRRGMASGAELDGVSNSGEPLQMSPSYAAANAGWTEEEIEIYRRRQEAIAARQAQNVAYVTAVDARIHEAEVENEEYRRARRKSHSKTSSSKAERTKSSGSAGKGNGGGENLAEIDVRKTVLGRIVKGASKTLFKKISSKELALQQQRGMIANGGGGGDDDGESSSTDDASLGLRRQQSDSGLKSSRRSSSHLRRTSTPPPLPLRPILLNGGSYTPVIVPRVSVEPQQQQQPQPEQQEAAEEEEEEEGRVWEEEIGETFPLNVGQTETFVEGRGVYSRTSTVESNGRSRSATPPITSTTTTATVVATTKAGKRASASLVSKVSAQAAVMT
ncbi:hypothetical protein CVT24_009250 [Panaeolus cyanescens]|uniref:Uncharacterized protein n=1 Tax=Panaeolus cyanescens TaxID=181874 RepID=A0A409Y866_9AGAR|nr:hypothetical protein CVT24_009250 [Panaeolus cyanescens]